MKRSGIKLSEVADFDNLASAFYAAAKGKSQHPDVARFGRELDKQLALMQAEILDGSIKLGDMTTFLIRDPKLRLIHAPCFRERVLHHAVMALVGPVLDRGLVFDTYACRKGKGTLAAVLRCQHFIRRHPIFVKIDIRSYFPNIDHEHLNEQLAHCFKDRNLLNLLARIIACCQAAPGKGLPIGALTSQHFANFYLGQLDRLLLEECRASGMVRYMDDVIWWYGSREAARTTLQIVE